jgi:hypothetical protein
MKSFSLVYSTARLVMIACSFALWPVVALASAIEPAVMCALRLAPVDLHALWQAIRLLPVNAFRVLGILKPVYRDSYATNGHSLGIACLT